MTVLNLLAKSCFRLNISALPEHMSRFLDRSHASHLFIFDPQLPKTMFYFRQVVLTNKMTLSCQA